MREANTIGRREQMMEPDLPVGGELFGYRVERLLGRGGMGVVYLAEDPRLRRRVALKVLTASLAEDDAFRERFLVEAELAASLDHPCVVPIYEAGEGGGRLFIAMRYVEGGDLKALIAGGPLTVERALGICAQVADALDFAHEHGLVHGDVKPSNVLLDGREHVYLADFGVTRRLEEPQLPGSGLFGTIDYVAPELIRGEQLDGRADQYALGCLLYECLSGGPPFARATDAAVLFAHLEEQPPAPPGLELAMGTALAKDPAERYGTCAEFVAAAADALGIDERARARLPGVPPGVGSDHRSARRRLTAGAVAIAIAAVLALVFALLTPNSAVTAQRRARSLALAADSQAQLSIDPELSVLLGIAAVRSSPTAQAMAALRDAMDATPLRFVRLPSVGFVQPRNSLEAYGCSCVAYSPNGRWLAESSQKGFVSIIDARTGTTVRRIQTGASAALNAWSPDGRLLLVATERAALLIDASTGATRARIPAMHYSAGLAFSADGSTVYGAGFTTSGWKAAQRGAMHVRGTWVGAWSLATGRYRAFRLPPSTSTWADRCVCSLALRPDGRQLAVGGWPGLAVFDTRTMQPVRVIAPLSLHHASGADVLTGKRWLSLAYSPDGSLLAGETDQLQSGVSEVRLLDARTLQVRGSVAAFGATPVVFSPDGSRIAYVAPSGGVMVFSLASHEPIARFPSPSRAVVSSLAFSPDGTKVATTTSGGDGQVWGAVGDYRLLIAPDADPRTSLYAALQRDRVVAMLTPASGPDAHEIVIESWSRTDGRPLASPLVVAHHSNPSGYGSLSGDGRYVAVVAGTRRTDTIQLDVWDLAKRRVVRTLMLERSKSRAVIPKGRVASTLTYDGVNLDPDTAWSPDDRYLAILPRLEYFTYYDPQSRTPYVTEPVAVFDLATGRSVGVGPTSASCNSAPSSVAWSVDSSLLAEIPMCGGLQLWSQSTHRVVYTTAGVEERVATSFNPDATRLIVTSATSPASVTVIDPRTGRTLLSLIGITGIVDRAFYSPDGRLIVTSNSNGQVEMWNARTGALLRTIVDPVTGHTRVEFGPDSSSILTVDAANNIGVIDSCPGCGNPAALVRLAEARVTRQLTAAERRLYHVG